MIDARINVRASPPADLRSGTCQLPPLTFVFEGWWATTVTSVDEGQKHTEVEFTHQEKKKEASKWYLFLFSGALGMVTSKLINASSRGEPKHHMMNFSSDLICGISICNLIVLWAIFLAILVNNKIQWILLESVCTRVYFYLSLPDPDHPQVSHLCLLSPAPSLCV